MGRGQKLVAMCAKERANGTMYAKRDIQEPISSGLPSPSALSSPAPSIPASELSWWDGVTDAVDLGRFLNQHSAQPPIPSRSAKGQKVNRRLFSPPKKDQRHCKDGLNKVAATAEGDTMRFKKKALLIPNPPVGHIQHHLSQSKPATVCTPPSEMEKKNEVGESEIPMGHKITNEQVPSLPVQREVPPASSDEGSKESVQESQALSSIKHSNDNLLPPAPACICIDRSSELVTKDLDKDSGTPQTHEILQEAALEYTEDEEGLHYIDPVTGILKPIQSDDHSHFTELVNVETMEFEINPVSDVLERNDYNNNHEAAFEYTEYEEGVHYIDPETGILKPIQSDDHSHFTELVNVETMEFEINPVSDVLERNDYNNNHGNEEEEIVLDTLMSSPVSAEGSGTTPIVVKKKTRKESPRDSVKKRTQNTQRWISTQRKIAKNTGKGFITPKGKVIKPAVMRNPCSCEKKCYQKLKEEQRRKIFDDFWAIGDHSRQWDYITRHSRNTPVKKHTTDGDSRRQFSRFYFFFDENNEIPVCKYMFMATLAIWDGWIHSAYKHVSGGATQSMSPDKRGKHHNRPFKTSQAKIDSICAHVNKYPKVPSHYTRARSKRDYVEKGLSVNKMTRHYEAWCKTEKIPPAACASSRQYRKIFNTKFNIGFFKPKKDQCSQCQKIKKCTRQERENMKASWVAHQKNKDASRAERAKWKKMATADHSISYVCFDLQKVIQCPKSDSSEFYYSSKLSVYNFSVFNAISCVGTCYLWNEIVGGRGANDIASCLLKYIESAANNGVKEIRSFSDSCAGQNRNRFVFSMMLLAAVRFNIKISHQFMEPGHTQNENDSVHALIETTLSRQDIFDFNEIVELIKTAKVEEPMYEVEVMDQAQFYDFKKLVNIQNWKTADDGTEIKWSQVRVLEFVGSEPDLVKFKYQYLGDFQTLRVKARRGRPVNLVTYQLSQAYTGPLPLSAVKQKCLTQLCRDLSIPSKYHGFWQTILAKDIPEITRRDMPETGDNEEIIDFELESVLSGFESENDENTDNQ